MLNLDFCTLSALPPVLGALTGLTTLDVEGNLYLGDGLPGADDAGRRGAGPGGTPARRGARWRGDPPRPSRSSWRACSRCATST